MTSNWNFWQTLAFTPIRWGLLFTMFWGALTAISCICGGLGIVLYLLLLVDPQYDLVWVLVGGVFTIASWFTIPLTSENDYFQNQYTMIIDMACGVAIVVATVIASRFM